MSYSQASNQNVGFLGGNNNSSGGSVAEGEGRWKRSTSTTSRGSPTSPTSPGSLLNKCNTPSPRGTPPPSVDAVSPPSVARELPIHKSWSMGDSWERGRVDRFAGFMSKTSFFQRDLVEKAASVGEHASSARVDTVSVRSSRDPRRKKQAMLRQGNEASLFDPTKLGKSCCISKVVKKMSFVEYQARKMNGKGTHGKEKEKSDGKAMLEDMEVEASAAAGQAMSEGRICDEGSKSGQNCLKKNVEEASNSKNGTKQTVAEENLEVPGPERVSCEENDCEAKVKRLLEELTQLSMDMEEEKEKSRRLHQENESLDIELELINEKLK